jgi:hypothetical protein
MCILSLGVQVTLLCLCRCPPRSARNLLIIKKKFSKKKFKKEKIKKNLKYKKSKKKVCPYFFLGKYLF